MWWRRANQLQPSSKAAPQATPTQGAAASSDKLSVDQAVATTNPDQIEVGALITNHSAKRVATSITAQATAFGPDGKVVAFSDGQWGVSVIHAGQTVPLAITINNESGKPIARTEIGAVASVGGWFDDANPKRAITGQELKVGKGRFEQTTGGGWQLQGLVANGYPTDLQKVRLNAVCTDAAGKINAAGWGDLEVLPAQGRAGASTDMAGEKPADVSRCQMSGAPASPMQGG